MSVSLREVLESGGYYIEYYDDAEWLLSKQSEIEDLISEAESVVEHYDEADPERLQTRAEDIRDGLREDGIDV